MKKTWIINENSLSLLESSDSWRSWAKEGNARSVEEVYGTLGPWRGIYGKEFDSQDEFEFAFDVDNLGGGVPYDVFSEMIKAAEKTS